jgi:putative membrane protein
MSTVAILGVVGALLASALHVAFFVVESLRFRSPSTWRAFGLKTQEEADAVAPMAFNQGFYNLFLAIGTVTGVVVLLAGEKTIGWALMLFGCGTMAGAALVLATSTTGLVRAALLQGVPPTLCIVTAIVNFT